MLKHEEASYFVQSNEVSKCSSHNQVSISVDMRLVNPRLFSRLPVVTLLLVLSNFLTYHLVCIGRGDGGTITRSKTEQRSQEVESEYLQRPSLGHNLRYHQTNEEKQHQAANNLAKVDLHTSGIRYQEIECLINGDYTIHGRREGTEVYLPFTFLEKYFEVYGKIAEYDGYDRFEWQHSVAHVYQQAPYKPTGEFMSFDHYNVEPRDRVKMISGVHGVPVSIQWDAQGYFYAIQVCQFGLSHYSKNLTHREPRVKIYEDAENEDLEKWSLADQMSRISAVRDETTGSNVIEFQTTDSLSPGQGATLPLNNRRTFVVSFDILLMSNSTITVTVQDDKDKPHSIHYVAMDDKVSHKGSHIFYGIGECSQWRRVTRDLVVDFQKGLGQTNKRYVTNIQIGLSRVNKFTVHGYGRIDNITLSSSSHMAQFFDAANWLLKNQDSNGGWPVMVDRLLAPGFQVLSPGWYSAMAQGQAISTLVRAYVRTKDRKYLDACVKATKLYQIPSSEGGVKAILFDQYTWYEEYPTTPSSYVLNGFIYSLIGLYDLITIASPEEGRDALQLYEDGIRSLKKFLLLFDGGTGTIYDLRHVTLGKAPNLARWDYHATHIAQLQLLASIDPDPVFKTTLQRWLGYTKGIRAKHN
ncbi:D-glucuronyl C5-epimerase B-like [Asterias amurensis]|uniref:D-glucuronyl C5-epimerase B-like n=1 Tax=Asterias amurensis TaxID=7602 RepID=UPI003AB3545B